MLWNIFKQRYSYLFFVFLALLFLPFYFAKAYDTSSDTLVYINFDGINPYDNKMSEEFGNNGVTIEEDGPVGDYGNFLNGDLEASNSVLDTSKAFTISIWFKQSDESGVSRDLFSNGNRGWSLPGVTAFLLDGQIYTMLAGTTGYPCGGLTVENNLDDDQWHLLTLTYSGDNSSNGWKDYIDGQLSDQHTCTIDGIVSTTNLVMGGQHDNSFPFIKYLDEFIVEQREWTAQEIEDYYNDPEYNPIIFYSEFFSSLYL